MPRALKKLFLLDPSTTFLNSGSFSAAPRPVVEAVRRAQEDLEANPTERLFGIWKRLWNAQSELARFLKARPQDLFLRSNVTEAMNVFLLGVPLGRGEIVHGDLEYGAVVNICRLRAAREGRRLRKIVLPGDPKALAGLTPDGLVDRILSQLTPSTRMLVLSHVMTANGLVLPLKSLARETRRRGIVLAVDGAHGPGALRLDFSTLGDVDFYGGNLHKWMLGPKGTGFGWVAPRRQKGLADLTGGWTTFETPDEFAGFGGGSRFAARMLKSSSYDFAPLLAIPAMLDFWRTLGPERVWSRLGTLRTHARAAMARAVDWPSCSPDHPELAGPLLAYRLPERLARLKRGLMWTLLREERLQVVTNFFKGRWHLRLSPHIYNDESDLDRAARILGKL